MLCDFIQEAKQQIQDSEGFYQKNDCKGVQSELHTLKGNSGTLGAAEVYTICKKIEAKAKVCDFKEFELEIELLKQALHRFEEAVQVQYA